MGRPISQILHPPIVHVTRDPIGGFPSDVLLATIREHTGQGERVRVRRIGYRSYDIVKNDRDFLVLPSLGGRPVGTFNNVAAAVLSGDRYVEAVRRGEFDAEDDDYPRGAA